MTLWIVVRYWPTMKREALSAWFDEQKARYEAGQQVGKDDGLISLETIEVRDEPKA